MMTNHKNNKRLNLRSETIRSLTKGQLDVVFGGADGPKPRTYACPSVDTVSCLPPKSDGCYTQTK
jgi:hypothetical protein